MLNVFTGREAGYVAFTGGFGDLVGRAGAVAGGEDAGDAGGHGGVHFDVPVFQRQAGQERVRGEIDKTDRQRAAYYNYYTQNRWGDGRMLRATKHTIIPTKAMWPPTK